MKTVLKFIIKHILAGFLCTMGIISAVYLVGYFTTTRCTFDTPPAPFRIVNYPDAVKVIEHSIVTDCDYFTVSGKIQNITNKSYTLAGVQVTVLADSAVIGDFSRGFEDIEPNEVREFIAESREIDGRGLPENISYKVEVMVKNFEDIVAESEEE